MTDIDYAEFDQLYRSHGGRGRFKMKFFVLGLEDGVPERYEQEARNGSGGPEQLRQRKQLAATALRKVGRELAKETGYARYAALRVLVHDAGDGDGPQVYACIPLIGQAGKYEGRWSEDVGEWDETPDEPTESKKAASDHAWRKELRATGS